MERVDFITAESGDDLIVSFAIRLAEPGEIRSLTLLRTPKYEFLLDESERGVQVSTVAAVLTQQREWRRPRRRHLGNRIAPSARLDLALA